VLEKAKDAGLTTGIIVAPVFPKKDWREDIKDIFEEAVRLKVDQIYGEALHVRGLNIEYIKEAIEDEKEYLDLFGSLNLSSLRNFDRQAGKWFNKLLKRYNLKGRWWYEH